MSYEPIRLNSMRWYREWMNEWIHTSLFDNLRILSIETLSLGFDCVGNGEFPVNVVEYDWLLFLFSNCLWSGIDVDPPSLAVFFNCSICWEDFFNANEGEFSFGNKKVLDERDEISSKLPVTSFVVELLSSELAVRPAFRLNWRESHWMWFYLRLKRDS